MSGSIRADGLVEDAGEALGAAVVELTGAAAPVYSSGVSARRRSGARWSSRRPGRCRSTARRCSPGVVGLAVDGAPVGGRPARRAAARRRSAAVLHRELGGQHLRRHPLLVQVVERVEDPRRAWSAAAGDAERVAVVRGAGDGRRRRVSGDGSRPRQNTNTRPNACTGSTRSASICTSTFCHGSHVRRASRRRGTRPGGSSSGAGRSWSGRTAPVPGVRRVAGPWCRRSRRRSSAGTPRCTRRGSACTRARPRPAVISPCSRSSSSAANAGVLVSRSSGRR